MQGMHSALTMIHSQKILLAVGVHHERMRILCSTRWELFTTDNFDPQFSTKKLQKLVRKFDSICCLTINRSEQLQNRTTWTSNIQGNIPPWAGLLESNRLFSTTNAIRNSKVIAHLSNVQLHLNWRNCPLSTRTTGHCTVRTWENVTQLSHNAPPCRYQSLPHALHCQNIY